MTTRLRVVANPGPIDPPRQVTIRARGINGAPAAGVLKFVDSIGRTHPIAKVPADETGVVKWVLTFEEGPELDIPPSKAPTTLPAEFRFSLEANAVNPRTRRNEPVVVLVADERGPVRVTEVGAGVPAEGDDARTTMSAFDLFLVV